MAKQVRFNKVHRMTSNGNCRHCQMYTRGLLLFVCIFLLFSCRSPLEVMRDTSSVKIETIYKDSITYRDSIIPIERHFDVARDFDTLVLETSQAKAQCWVDSIWLKGSITNKDVTRYKYIDRWHTITNDSIVYKDKIDYIETVKHIKRPLNWWSIGLNVVFILIAVVCVLMRFRR